MSPFIKDIIREIKRTFNRFIAIFAIVALGVGFLAGLKVTCRVMKNSADAYYDSLHYADFRLLSTLGFTEDDVSALKATGLFDNVIPSHGTDMLLESGGGEYVMRLFESSEGLNDFLLKDGRFAENSRECVLDYRLANDIDIGDVISVSSENDETVTDMMLEKSFTVVGFVASPVYVSFERGNSTIGNGSVDGYIGVLPEVFDSETYLDISLSVNGAAALECYGEDYESLIEEVTALLEDTAEVRAEARYNDLYAEYSEKIDDGQSELDEKSAEAEKKLADALSEIEEGEKNLAASEKKYNSGVKKYKEGKAEYERGLAELAASKPDAVKRLEEATVQYERGKAAYEENTALYNGMLTSLQALKTQIIEAESAGQTATAEALQIQYGELSAQCDLFKSGLDTALAELQSAEAGIKSGYGELEAAQNKLESAKTTLDNTEKQLKAAKKEIEKGKQKLSDARAEYEKGRAEADSEIAEAQKKIDEGRRELDDLQKPEWYITDRTDNPGYSGYGSDSDKIDAIAAVFPVFFFLVAALVCLTTMTRMVEEQRTQIGVMKALGFGKGAIAAKYLVYADLSCILGSVAGLCVGYAVFPSVIILTYEMMYDKFDAVLEFNVEYALISGLCALACISLATLWACMNELRSVPSQLMRPKSPPKGKKIFLEYIKPLWKRMSFSHKVSARNLIRYKKRFFMTLVGIAGCTALLLTGFGLSDSISDILYKQFDDIWNYDITAALDDGADYTEAEADVSELLENYIFAEEKSATVKNNGANFGIYTVVPRDADRLCEFITFRDRESGDAVAFPQNDGVVITEKLSYRFDIYPGDEIIISPDGVKEYSFTVAAITENYAYNYVYITPEQYKAVMGCEPHYNTVFGTFGDNADEDAVCDGLMDNSAVIGLQKFSDTRTSFSKILKGLDAVVILIIVCAALLAFIVLYNLTNINITERLREIATIKVLGFTDGEVAAYVFRENFVLTLLGDGAGLLLGIVLHRFVIVTAEVDMVMFGRSLHPMSYVYAFLMTLLFSAAVSLVMYFRLKKISMVESLKSVE